MFSFGRKSNSVMFSAIAAMGIQFTSTAALAQEPVANKRAAKQLCTWVKAEKEITQKIDSSLIVFNSEKNEYENDETGVLAPKEIECLQDKVLLHFEAGEGEQKSSWTWNLQVTESGNVALEKGKATKGFRKTIYSGDGQNNLKVLWHFADFEKAMSLDLPRFFETSVNSYLQRGVLTCDKSLAELEALGATKITSINAVNTSSEFVYSLKPNGKYTLRHSSLAGGYFKYTTDKSDVSLVCSQVKRFDIWTNTPSLVSP